MSDSTMEKRIEPSRIAMQRNQGSVTG
jgi:hypothetical protein